MRVEDLKLKIRANIFLSFFLGGVIYICQIVAVVREISRIFFIERRRALFVFKRLAVKIFHAFYT